MAGTSGAPVLPVLLPVQNSGGTQGSSTQNIKRKLDRNWAPEVPSGSTGQVTGTSGQQCKLAFCSTFRDDSFGIGFLHILDIVRALDCIVVNIKTHGDSKCSFNLPLFGVDDNTTNKHS